MTTSLSLTFISPSIFAAFTCGRSMSTCVPDSSERSLRLSLPEFKFNTLRMLMTRVNLAS